MGQTTAGKFKMKSKLINLRAIYIFVCFQRSVADEQRRKTKHNQIIQKSKRILCVDQEIRDAWCRQRSH